jgi:hypothetical protein
MMVLDEIEPVLLAYRKSRRTMWAHGIFLALCIAVVVIARRIIGLPPQVLATVIIVALVVFGRDIMVFLHLRSRLSQLRAQSETS